MNNKIEIKNKKNNNFLKEIGFIKRPLLGSFKIANYELFEAEKSLSDFIDLVLTTIQSKLFFLILMDIDLQLT